MYSFFRYSFFRFLKGFIGALIIRTTFRGYIGDLITRSRFGGDFLIMVWEDLNP